jgi:glycosyltransferase involved in cell wall biosynthesis
MKIDVCMATWNSSDVLDETLDMLRESELNSDVDISRLIVVDNNSTDETLEIIESKCIKYGWETDIQCIKSSLPEARKLGIDSVETEWFLFLDDDVRLTESYLEDLSGAIGSQVGAVQGRKQSRTESNTDWVRRRARRGGTHATLIRHTAISGIGYPADLNVLEDEYSRRYVEDMGYLWIFNHQAIFTHALMDRHPIGWQEGYLGGKYGLSVFHTVLLNIPYAIASKRNPIPHIWRTVGWLWGYRVSSKQN